MQTLLMEIRKKGKESQKDLAHLLKISEESYRNKELGKTQFKMDEMFIISNHYDRKIEDIFLPRKFTYREYRNKQPT